jgi:hypothetical protein
MLNFILIFVKFQISGWRPADVEAGRWRRLMTCRWAGGGGRVASVAWRWAGGGGRVTLVAWKQAGGGAQAVPVGWPDDRSARLHVTRGRVGVGRRPLIGAVSSFGWPVGGGSRASQRQRRASGRRRQASSTWGHGGRVVSETTHVGFVGHLIYDG